MCIPGRGWKEGGDAYTSISTATPSSSVLRNPTGRLLLMITHRIGSIEMKMIQTRLQLDTYCHSHLFQREILQFQK